MSASVVNIYPSKDRHSLPSDTAGPNEEAKQEESKMAERDVWDTPNWSFYEQMEEMRDIRKKREEATRQKTELMDEMGRKIQQVMRRIKAFEVPQKEDA